MWAESKKGDKVLRASILQRVCVANSQQEEVKEADGSKENVENKGFLPLSCENGFRVNVEEG